MTTRYLYILVEHGGMACKIGISGNPRARSGALPQSFDYSSSVMVSLPFSDAGTVERFIHTVLREFSLSVHRGDGHTEWFGIEAKERAIHIVDSFRSSLLAGDWEKIYSDEIAPTDMNRKKVPRRPWRKSTTPIRLDHDILEHARSLASVEGLKISDILRRWARVGRQKEDMDRFEGVTK